MASSYPCLNVYMITAFLNLHAKRRMSLSGAWYWQCILEYREKGLHQYALEIEFFHMTLAKSTGGKTGATSLHAMLSMVHSLNSRFVVSFSA